MPRAMQLRQDGDTGEKWDYLNPEEQQAIVTLSGEPTGARRTERDASPRIHETKPGSCWQSLPWSPH